MNKKIVLSAISLGLLSSVNVHAAEDLSSMLSEGKTSGQIRAFYVDRQYNGSLVTDASANHRNAFNIGGHLKFETAELNGLSFATSFYTTNNINAFNYGGGSKHDPSLTGSNGDGYSILGEAYVNYKIGTSKTNAKLGFQRYDTPMMGSDDARMIPNTFQAYKLVSKDVENVTFQVAHVNQITYGTFSNIYKHDGTSSAKAIVASTSGYTSAANSATGKYVNLGEATVGEKTAGVTNVLVCAKGDSYKVRLSNDFAYDMYNTLYMDAMVKASIVSVSAQVIKQNSVGKELMQNSSLAGTGEIDSLYWAAKVAVKSSGATVYAAYSQTGANDSADLASNTYKNAIVSQFGGMPAYTQGMVTRHQFLAGTKAMKFVGAYNFKDMGTNLSAAAYYASFDMDANSGYGVERTAHESGFDVKYTPESVKKLQLRFRGNFPRKFYESASGDKGWNEYRLIANYTF